MPKTTSLNPGEQIIRDYYEEIYRYCYWHTKGSPDAQDITQDTFLHFLQSVSDYSDVKAPKALLYTIAKNLCINWSKKIKPDSIEDEYTELPLIDDFSDIIIQKKWLYDAIASLPPLHQEVLLLRYGQDMKVTEIAGFLCISRFSVMYRLRCAVKQLQKIMKESEL